MPHSARTDATGLAVIAILVACTKPAPRVADPVVPSGPTGPAPITPADVSKITLDPAAGEWVLRVDNDLREYTLNTKQAFGRFYIEAWNPTWPGTAADFEAKLGTSELLGSRYKIAERTASAGEWLFRGVLVFDDATLGQNLAFVMVRTVGNARYLCTGWSQTNDPDEVVTSIAGCRATRP